MKRHIHIFGASGSGTTTIAREAAQQLDYAHFDSDNYFWLPTEEPFTAERSSEERIRLMKSDLTDGESWILSGSLSGWGEELLPLFDLVIFVYVNPDERVERLKKREFQRYGARILSGGDHFEASKKFIEWAATYDSGSMGGRSLKKHLDLLSGLSCEVMRLENGDFEESVRRVIEKINQRN